jgi:DNA polymerase
VPILHRDIETRSTLRLADVGAWRYAGDPSTEVLCICYAIDDAPVRIWTPDLPIPEEFYAAARDPNWLVAAHNDQFESAIEEGLLGPRFGWSQIPIAQHRCTMATALANALPGALDKATAAIGLPVRKDAEGRRLMMQMSRPRKPRKGEDPSLIYWHDGPELRQRLGLYCRRDVETERAIYHRLPQLSPAEQALWVLDAHINRRGFHIDRTLAVAGRELVGKEQECINAAISELTGGRICTANQVARIQNFVCERGHQLTSLSKRSVAALLAKKPSEDVRQLLELRRDGGRSSAHKLDTLLAGLDSDDRLRGTLRFHGAATGRWSGARFQPQNLKKAETKDLGAAIDAILAGNIARVRELGAPLTVVGDISRAMICAARGCVLFGADFSAIESRVLAWVAGEQWKLENYREFDRTGDPKLEPYCVTAAKILGRPVTPENENDRKTGKTADLACGYGGSVGAWRRFAPEDERSDADIQSDIASWRTAHPATVRFWRALENGLRRTLRGGQPITLGNLACEVSADTLYITLPSDRRLAYPHARLEPGRYDVPQIVFKDNTRGGWTDCRGWYGTFTENVVQAISRDLLAAAMGRLEAAGYGVILHCHDECVCEVPEGFGSTDEFRRLMTAVPRWATGLPLAAKIWTRERYANPTSQPSLPTLQPSSQASESERFIASKINSVLSYVEPVTEPIGVSRQLQAADDEHSQIPLADLIEQPLSNGKIHCPFHADDTPSLQIYDDHFHCFGCGAHGDHIEWLMMVEGLDRDTAIQRLATWDGPIAQPRLADSYEAKLSRALQLWQQAQPIPGTLAARYLTEWRRIDLGALPGNVDDVLRFHPCCPFGPGIRRPCLIALMRDVTTDVPTGIHRIALTPDGRKIERRMLGCGGTVKLWPAEAQLIVGEGIETTLAAATRISHNGAPLQPAWSAVSSGALGKLPIVPGVEQLVILVDNDINGQGQAAAARCAERWTRAGRRVIQLKPKRPGADFNDLVMRQPVS